MYYDPNIVVRLAKAERGYLEKKNPDSLDSKTANAGKNNYTKYGRDLVAWTGKETGDTYGINYSWCDQFVDWVFVKAYGIEAAKKLLGGFSAYTPTSAQFFKNIGRLSKKPARGAIIYFAKESKIAPDRPNGIYHTGIVRRYDDKKVYTIEGNTSGSYGVVSNGGGVFEKSYYLNNKLIYGYGIPDFGNPDPVADNVVLGKTWLNDYYNTLINEVIGENLKEDGTYDEKTRAAILAVWKDLTNRKTGSNLYPLDPNFGDACMRAADNDLVKVRFNSDGTYAYLCKLLLSAHGFYDCEMDSTVCTADLCSWIQSYEMAKGLAVDSGDQKLCYCGPEVWHSLFNT